MTDWTPEARWTPEDDEAFERECSTFAAATGRLRFAVGELWRTITTPLRDGWRKGRRR